MTKQHTTSSAIREVLAGVTEPMKAGEIAKLVVPLVPGLKGKTPAATVAAKIYTAAKTEGGLVRKEGDGFVLNTDAKPKTDKAVSGPRRDGESPAVVPGTVVLRDGKAKPDPKPTPRKKSQRRQAAAAA